MIEVIALSNLYILVRSKYKFNAGSRKNLIVIKPEKCKINEQKTFLKLGLLNIRSLTPKAVIVNEMITDNSFDVLCLTETWLKPNDYIGLNESTPPSYCYKHEPRQTGRESESESDRVDWSWRRSRNNIQYSDILNVTQKTGYRFNSFEILLLNNPLTVHRPTCGRSFFRCIFSLSNILVIIINYISFESLKPQNSSCENHFEIGYCVTMEMVL